MADQTDAQVLEESRQYLENFWVPQSGSHVRFRKTLAVLYLERIYPDYPEQVLLLGRREVAWVQDLEWVPTPREIWALLERAGIKVHETEIQLGNTFQSKPSHYVEVAEALRTYRQLRLLTDGIDPYIALTSNT